ncbi:hypothetical protein JNUCC31_06650 [Paenibacillus sp. JNUCC31]|uniref:hypothetical protein n=1 Tax=Paenibacillus sp. JNUCC-31 TaxID=2777983 RepID=UPI001784142D|nr:hypothetical protein [Paenibacillus sp. JNUCC-31]QOS80578.1 hypothetical protein JNUCC31_06650 [Paenibacillus sp. JNUCC-31]
MAKLRFTIIISLIALVSVLLISCNEKKEVSLDDLIKTMKESSLNIETDEVEVASTHYAYNPEKKMFYLGLQFNNDEVPSNEQQKAIYEKFLSKASEVTNTGDWKKALELYNVTFEQLLPNNKKKILAIKKENSDIIELINSK